MTFATKRRVAYFYDAEVGNYYYSQGHPMKPHRMRMTHNLLLSYGLLDKMDVFVSPRSTHREMTRFHSDEYISFLNSISPDTLPDYTTSLCRFNVLEDCPVFDGLWEYCQIAAGGSLAGAARLNAGDSSVAINWAGGLHHAKRAEASGFCYINDCVLAILELLKIHARVLYVDIDIHHGDGVEEAFYTTDRVMTASFHKYGDYFPGTGDVSDIGISRGKYYSANFPLRDGIDDDSYREIFVPVMSRIMEWYQPGVVVLQCGADSLSGDRLGCFNLSLMGHAQCVDFFKRYDVPLLLLGGGGYTIRNVARCWAYETSRVVGETLSDELPFNENFEFYGPEFRLHIVPSNMENHNSPTELHKTKVKIFEHLRHLPHAPSPPMIDIPRNSPVSLHRLEDDGHSSAIATFDDDDDPDIRKRRRRAIPVVDYMGSDEEDDDQYISSLRYVKRKCKRTNFPRRRYPTAVLMPGMKGAAIPQVGKSVHVHDMDLGIVNEKATSSSERFEGQFERESEDKEKTRSPATNVKAELQRAIASRPQHSFHPRKVQGNEAEKVGSSYFSGERTSNGTGHATHAQMEDGAKDEDETSLRADEDPDQPPMSEEKMKSDKHLGEDTPKRRRSSTDGSGATGERKTGSQVGSKSSPDGHRHPAEVAMLKRRSPSSPPKDWMVGSRRGTEYRSTQREEGQRGREDNKHHSELKDRTSGREQAGEGSGEASARRGFSEPVESKTTGFPPMDFGKMFDRDKNHTGKSGNAQESRETGLSSDMEKKAASMRGNDTVPKKGGHDESKEFNESRDEGSRVGRTEQARVKKRVRDSEQRDATNGTENGDEGMVKGSAASRGRGSMSLRGRGDENDGEGEHGVSEDKEKAGYTRRGKSGPVHGDGKRTESKQLEESDRDRDGADHGLSKDGARERKRSMDGRGEASGVVGDRKRDGSKRGRARNGVDVGSEKSDDSVRESTGVQSGAATKIGRGESDKSEESESEELDGYPCEVEEEDMTPSEESHEHNERWNGADCSDEKEEKDEGDEGGRGKDAAGTTSAPKRDGDDADGPKRPNSAEDR